MPFEPLFRAVPVPRGCRDRTPGGLYVESGLGPGGEPIERFLVDPPLPIPDGLDLVNKPQIVEDPATGIPHLWLWIGAEWYPYAPDYIEETRRYGASRKLNPNLDLARLVPGSRIILAHPSARNTSWQEQALPHECLKRLPGHALIRSARSASGATPATAGRSRAPADHSADLHEARRAIRDSDANPDTVTAAEGSHAEQAPEGRVLLLPTADDTTSFCEAGWGMPSYVTGPCLFKTYELMPVEAAADVEHPALVEGRTWYARHIGSTTYLYDPSGESSEGLAPGVFAALPITGFALIRHADGSVNDRAEAKLRDAGLPYYTPFA